MGDAAMATGGGTAAAVPRAPLKSRFMNSPAKPGQAYVPTNIEHIANMTTHGLWIIPSLIGMFIMMGLSTSRYQYLSAVVYGGALMALFTTSTTFHILSYSGRFRTLKNFFHIGDRAVIYIFIAASYTPWLTLKDLNGWGAQMMWIVWIGAVLGIIYQYTYHEQYKWLETVLYLIVGVCPAVIIFAMEDHSGLFEMMVGGLIYISGVVFFKCDGLIPFAHAIWHCFVIVGAVFHFCAVCKYLLGQPQPSDMVS